MNNLSKCWLGSVILCGALLNPMASAYAARVCCKDHGGPGKCVNNLISQCKDGSAAHCKCVSKDTKKSKTSKTTGPLPTPVRTKSNWFGFGSTPVSTKASSKTDGHSGCCSHHKGITGTCVKGKMKCKDGSISQSCSC